MLKLVLCNFSSGNSRYLLWSHWDFSAIIKVWRFGLCEGFLSKPGTKHIIHKQCKAVGFFLLLNKKFHYFFKGFSFLEMNRLKKNISCKHKKTKPKQTKRKKKKILGLSCPLLREITRIKLQGSCFKYETINLACLLLWFSLLEKKFLNVKCKNNKDKERRRSN